MAFLEERPGVGSRWREGSVEALTEEDSSNGELGRMLLQLLELSRDICDIHISPERTRTPPWPGAEKTEP